LSKEEVECMYAILLEKILSYPFTVYNIKLSLDIPSYFPYELISKGENYKFFSSKSKVYFYEFEECVIWGLTANILNSFVNIIKSFQLKI
ncbi:MAG: NUDIX hydrolase, partial [Peptoanaerobacter stomatis]